MKAIALAALLLPSTAALAAPLEDAYIAARDRDIAALTKIEDSKDAAARDAQYEKAAADLERTMTSIIGPFAVPGFPTKGTLNLDALFPHDEGFGMLDGLVYGESESDKNVVVTTDGLLDRWLVANRDRWGEGSALPTDAAAAVKTENFYTMAVSTDAAVEHYAEIPVAAPAGAKFVHATLSARTQDGSPETPDQIFVALEKGGRVFIINEKLATPMAPIAACNTIIADYAKKAETADKAYADGNSKDAQRSDDGPKLRDEGDTLFRACFGKKAKGTPAFKAAIAQVAAIVAAFKN